MQNEDKVLIALLPAGCDDEIIIKRDEGPEYEETPKPIPFKFTFNGLVSVKAHDLLSGLALLAAAVDEMVAENERRRGERDV